MYRIILPLLIFGSLIVTYSDSAVQTDWSGGPGVLGPVIEWSDQFYLDTYVRWNIPGDIVLQLIAKYTVDGNFEDARFVYSEDIDGDGDMDVLGAAGDANNITWWENIDGSGTSWSEHTVDGYFYGACSVYSEDIDGDGDMDVLGAAAGLGGITWWENEDGSGTSWIEHTVDDDPLDWATSVYSKDIDGDGDMDILGADLITRDITWWENLDGSGTSWIDHIVDGYFNGVRCVYSEDMNGDGDMDVLGAAEFADDITWWENIDGSGTSWTEYTVDGDFDGAYFVYSEDIDGDGDMDILGAAADADDITWWENINGSGNSWIEHTVDGDFDCALSVHSEDIDGDGDMDILGAAVYDDDITWWENIDGTGTSWIEHTVDGDFRWAYSVYSGDIDGDGCMDVLGASRYDNEITWWDLTEYSPEGSLESSIFDTGCSPQWASIDWNSSEPAGTDLYFQYRTSNDPGSMGIWSIPIYEPCFLSGLLDQYFQYKVSMETDDQDLTPMLHDLTLNWDPYGIECDPNTSDYSLLGVIPNPICGAVNIRFGLPELSLVSLSVFDLSGRLVSENHGDDYSMGFHDVLLGNLTPGIYFCRMISGGFTATQRFVVIE